MTLPHVTKLLKWRNKRECKAREVKRNERTE